MIESMNQAVPDRVPSAPISRLTAIEPLDVLAIHALQSACQLTQPVLVGRALPNAMREGCLLVVSGWAARAETSARGKLQLVQLFIPGDTIPPVDIDRSTILALTDFVVARAPSGSVSPSLYRAFQRDAFLQTSYFSAQIARLGSLLAHDRLFDLIGEIYERALIAGVTDGNTLNLPLTQQHLAGLLALTPVHVNRSVRRLREEERLTWSGHRIVIAADSPIKRRAVANIQALNKPTPYPQRSRADI